MIKFPGEEDGLYYVKKNDDIVFLEPLPKVGSITRCLVVRSTPSVAFLTICKINGIDTNVSYKAQLRLQDLKLSIDENTFVNSFYEKGDVFDALMIGFGDHNGIYVSTISKDLGKKLNP